MTPLSLTEDIVLKKLSQLKLRISPELDQLHPKILYETRDVIAYPLYLIFNKSLQTGIFKHTMTDGMYSFIPRTSSGTVITHKNFQPFNPELKQLIHKKQTLDFIKYL